VAAAIASQIENRERLRPADNPRAGAAALRAYFAVAGRGFGGFHRAALLRGLLLILKRVSRHLLPFRPLDKRLRNLVPHDHDAQDAVVTKKKSDAGPAASIVGCRAHAGASSHAEARLTVVTSLNISGDGP